MMALAPFLDRLAAAAQRGATVRKIPLGFQDPDPNRNRFHRDMQSGINALVGQVVEVTVPSVADSEFSVTHSLGRKPAEFALIFQTMAGRLYASGLARWTERIAFFRYDAAGPGRISIRLR
jgi:hypothetical protein